jgi:hypothetical protein
LIALKVLNVPQESAAGAHSMAPIGRQHDSGARPGAWAVGFSFTEKSVVLGARLRNESAAQESTRGFRSAPPADRPERKGHPSESWFSCVRGKSGLRPLSTNVFQSYSATPAISNFSYSN